MVPLTDAAAILTYEEKLQYLMRTKANKTIREVLDALFDRHSAANREP